MKDSMIDENKFVNQLLTVIRKHTELKPRTILPIDKSRTQNHNFVVDTDSGKYFVKVYSSGTFNERIFEINVLKELQAKGITFSPNIVIKEPLTLNSLPVLIFDYIPGNILRENKINKKVKQDVAVKLAQVHNILALFNPGTKERFNAFSFDFANTFNLNLSDPLIVMAFKILEKAFKNTSAINKLPKTIIHDDLSTANVMHGKDGNLYFIDFDDAHRSQRISDIGTVIKEFIIEPEDKVNMTSINRFISSYEATEGTLPLNKNERNLILVMALRRAVFMYAYYVMVEKERNQYLRSKKEYSTISLILDSFKNEAK